MTQRLPNIALALALAVPAAASAEDYLGILKPPRAVIESPATGFYSFASRPSSDLGSARGIDSAYRLKLGYNYSRYFAVTSEFIDFGRAPADIFASPGNLASAFRSSGFGVDAVATLPLWRFSFYGRMGAYRGDARDPFNTYSTALLDSARSTRWRYGLGVRYDITRSLGVRAEMERYSPLGSPLSGDAESDQFTVGLSYRF